MANLTKAQLANRILEKLGVKAAGQATRSEYTTLVQEKIDAVHDRLRGVGLAPYATSAIPEWAQGPLQDLALAESAPFFGKPIDVRGVQKAAEREIRRQLANQPHVVQTKADYY